MLTGNKNPLRTYPSLLPLRMALIAAESESPAQPPRVDTNETLALQLIARMQAEYKKVLPFLEGADMPQSYGVSVHLHDMAVHA